MRDRVDVLVGDDARPEAVADRRADRLHLALLAVERHGEELLVLHPEALVEALLEVARLLRHALGPLDVAELPVDRRQPPLRVVDVALDLGQRDRPLGERAVGVHDGVAGVAPALVQEPGARAPLVLHEPVAVGVAVHGQPLDGGLDGLVQQVEALEVAGPHRQLAEGEQPQRRRVDGAEVGRVRDGAQVGELAAPQLVHDLARLLLAEGGVDAALASRQVAHARSARSAGRGAASRGPPVSMARPNGAANQGTPARVTRPSAVGIVRMRRSSWARRSTAFSCSLSV